MSYGRRNTTPAFLADDGTTSVQSPTMSTTRNKDGNSAFSLSNFKNLQSGGSNKTIRGAPSITKKVDVTKEATNLSDLANQLNAEMKTIDTTDAFGRMMTANVKKYSRMIIKGKTASKKMRTIELTRTLESAKKSWAVSNKLNANMEKSIIREATTKGTKLYDTYAKLDTIGAISTTCGMLNLLKAAHFGSTKNAGYDSILSDVATKLKACEDVCLLELEKEIGNQIKYNKKPNLSIFEKSRQVVSEVTANTTDPDLDARLFDTMFDRVSDYLVSETLSFFTNLVRSVSEMSPSSPTHAAIVSLSKSFDVRTIRKSVLVNTYRSLAIRQTVDMLATVKTAASKLPRDDDSVSKSSYFGVRISENMNKLKRMVGAHADALEMDEKTKNDLERFVIESFGYNSQDFTTRPKVDRNSYDNRNGVKEDDGLSYYFLGTTPFLLSVDRLGSDDFTAQEKSFLKFVDVCFSALARSGKEKDSVAVENFQIEFVSVLAGVFSSEAVLAFNVFGMLDAMLCSHGHKNHENQEKKSNTDSIGLDFMYQGTDHLPKFGDNVRQISAIVENAKSGIADSLEKFFKDAMELSKESADSETMSRIEINSPSEKYEAKEWLVEGYQRMSTEILSALMNAFAKDRMNTQNVFQTFKTSSNLLYAPDGSEIDRMESHRVAFSELKKKMRDSLNSRSQNNVTTFKLAKTILSWLIIDCTVSAAVSVASSWALSHWSTSTSDSNKGNDPDPGNNGTSQSPQYEHPIFASIKDQMDAIVGAFDKHVPNFNIKRTSKQYKMTYDRNDFGYVTGLNISQSYADNNPKEVIVNLESVLKEANITLRVLPPNELAPEGSPSYTFKQFLDEMSKGGPSMTEKIKTYLGDTYTYVFPPKNATVTVNGTATAGAPAESSQFVKTLHDISVAYTELHPEIKFVADEQRKKLLKSGITLEYFQAMLTNIQKIISTVNLTIGGEALYAWASGVFGSLGHVLINGKTRAFVSLVALGTAAYGATMVDYTLLQYGLATAAFVCGSSLATLTSLEVTKFFHNWANTDAPTVLVNTKPAPNPRDGVTESFNEADRAYKHLIASFVSGPDEGGMGSTSTPPNLSEKARQEWQHIVHSGWSISMWAPKIVNGLLTVVPPIFAMYQLVSIGFSSSPLLYNNTFTNSTVESSIGLSGFANNTQSFLMLLASSAGSILGSYPICVGITAVVMQGYVGWGCRGIHRSERTAPGISLVFPPSSVWPTLCVAVTKRVCTEFSVPGTLSWLEKIASSKSRILPAICVLSKALADATGIIPREALVTAAFLVLADNTEYLDDLRNYANTVYKSGRGDSFHPDDTKGIVNASVLNPYFSKLLQGTWLTLKNILNLVTRHEALKICFAMLKSMSGESSVMRYFVDTIKQLSKWYDVTEIVHDSHWFALMIICVAGAGMIAFSLGLKFNYFDVGNVSKVKDALAKEESIKVAKQLQEELEVYYKYGSTR